MVLLELENLVDEIDIVEFISQYVELEERNGEWWGLSPFKNEVTPSFSVRRESKQFYDFSTGIGGNVFTFVKTYNHCGANEAINILCRYVGGDSKNFTSCRKLSAAIVCKKFKPPIQNHKQSKMKIYPKDYMKERFEKRKEKLEIWKLEGISQESLDRFQVYYDSFSNRIVYPIKNIAGDIVNIGGRTLDPLWKEKKLKKYCYFSGWGTLDVIYGFFENMSHILEKREVILFEGCKSVLLADTWGIKNCGAILTSHLNIQQFKLLVSTGCRVVFALDKDVRIRNDRNIKKLARYISVEYLWDYGDLLNSKDSPVDKGEEIFKTLYERRLRYY